MSEYRTATVEARKLAELLVLACERLSASGIDHASVSFGWDSELPIEDMWKPADVPTGEVPEVIEKAEREGIVTLGAADIFIESPGFRLVLCHESDAHISGESPLVLEILATWRAQGLEPYEVVGERQ